MLNIIVYQASNRLLIRAVFLFCRIQQSPNPGLPCTSCSLLNIVYNECHYNVYSVYVFLKFYLLILQVAIMQF